VFGRITTPTDSSVLLLFGLMLLVNRPIFSSLCSARPRGVIPSSNTSAMVGLQFSFFGKGRLALNSTAIGVMVDAMAVPAKVRGGHGYGEGGDLKWVFPGGESTTAKRTTLEGLAVPVSITSGCGGSLLFGDIKGTVSKLSTTGACGVFPLLDTIISRGEVVSIGAGLLRAGLAGNSSENLD
jgi:hypothetical protein